jgi:hypothetical protein
MIVINDIEEFNILPKRVKTLIFEKYFNKKINIPNSVQTLTIYENFNKYVIIPLHAK